MKTNILRLVAALILMTDHTYAQTVTNGNFNSGITGWGCAPEVGAETIYGGTAGGNNCAEVDGQPRSLCQTVSGFTVGTIYVITLDAARRTNCPEVPASISINLTISGGALSATITRTNTTFLFSLSSFSFTATSTSHSFTIATSLGYTPTCGMMVDNISIASALPVELISFTNGGEDNVDFFWSTATEKNNDYFEIERSVNGTDYKTVTRVNSKAGPSGNYSSRLDYSAKDPAPDSQQPYYRLSQRDKDGSVSHSHILYVVGRKQMDISLSPNPCNGSFSIHLTGAHADTQCRIVVRNMLGDMVFERTVMIKKNESHEEFYSQSSLPGGNYVCELTLGTQTWHRKLIVMN